MSILDELSKRIITLDGGTGTLLMESGLTPGARPDEWGIRHPREMVSIHRKYYEAGSDVVLSNTFGSNAIKLHGSSYSVEQIVSCAVDNLKNAAASAHTNGRKVFAALDVGPTGKLLKPLGDLDFVDALAAYRQLCTAGSSAGADMIFVETMSDTYELKAAVLAAKETGLPVFATVALDKNGKLLTGAPVAAVVALLEGLGVDALGFNCGLGPIQLRPFVDELLSLASVPVIVKPNAGLPRSENGTTVYDIDSDIFASTMREFVEKGCRVVGGCCGTTPQHIQKLSALCSGLSPVPLTAKTTTVVSSYGKAVAIPNPLNASAPVIIGERINPTGKKRLKQALRDENYDVLLDDAVTQQEQGAHILDVNVGLPELDEKAVLPHVVSLVQSVTDLPLQLDSADPDALEAAMLIYNGKPLINSVNGKASSMASVLPLIKKYGGTVIALTLDENGIPDTAQGRLGIAEKIITKAAELGIDKRDIIVDPLCLSVSTGADAPAVTLESIELIRKKLGVATVLGLSNVSFGLPVRENINSCFYTLALSKGLDCAIINPGSEAMQKSYWSYLALSGQDAGCIGYIGRYSGVTQDAPAAVVPAETTLKKAIEKGLDRQAAKLTETALLTQAPMDIIDQVLIPALNEVGSGFEKGTVFLPQLLMSADAAKAAFEVIRANMPSDCAGQKGEKIVIATVFGDIHDIGKNIVKVLLENYGFDVIDLGKDVPPDVVVAAVKKHGAKLVGLSALMTTTVPAMGETIRLLNEACPDCRVVVGGAVLNEEYAQMIKADKYAADAMATVRYSQEVLGQK